MEDAQPALDAAAAATHTNSQDNENSKKISAYYSLVFPHFTFYIQTLSITIGRRCNPTTNATPSSSTSSAEQQQVDVDLGALRSVSRLHAKIEYDAEEDRFVLQVLGRNGAWVDGVWYGSSSRAVLGERSQIQIASRIFHFVLPPPPPEDAPSPSSQSSANRPRSPSLDITSISPPSSLPSHSPPPRPAKLPSPPPEPQLAPVKSKKPVNPKKRKKNDVNSAVPSKEKPKPEEMPPKPAFTYAQLIYRAIKALDGKATLQEIINWIMNEYDYYRYADGTAWTSSVRHNLSSSRAFKKMERCGGDRGKGFFWSLDEEHLQNLEEQEAKNQVSASQTGGKDVKRRKDKGGPLSEPPLKRSIKGDLNAPLPPPLTSTGLPNKTVSTTVSTTVPASAAFGTPAATGIFAYNSFVSSGGYTIPSSNPYSVLTQGSWAAHNRIASSTSPVASPPPPAPTVTQEPSPQATEQAAPAIPDVIVPIVLGPIPPSHPDYSANSHNNSVREGYMILHEGKIIIDPDIFSEFTAQMLDDLSKLGARQALLSLTGHTIKALREKRAKARKGAKAKAKGGKNNQSRATTGSSTNLQQPSGSADSAPGFPQPVSEAGADSPIVIVDESDEDGPAVKKRKTENTAPSIGVS